jgi:PAS domain S-box-containing protein
MSLAEPPAGSGTGTDASRPFMMSDTLRIVLLEDRPADADMILRVLAQQGIGATATRVWTETDYLAALRDPTTDLVLAAYSLPLYSGREALAAARARRPDLPFIFVSGSIGEERAIDALQEGATDYVIKDRIARLGPAVRRALREVEERRRLEKAQARLLRSERKHRAFFNATLEVIVVLDAGTGAIVDVNETMTDVFGYASDEVRGLTLNDLGAGGGPHSQAGAIDVVRRALTSGPQVVEWPCRKRHGEIFWAEIAMRATTIEGEPRVLAVVRDITVRKEALAALRESQERFRAVVETAPDAIIVQAGGRFAYLNPTALRLFGVTSPSELLGQPVLDRFDAKSQAMVRERIRILRDDHRAVPLAEETVVRTDGTCVDVEVSAVPFRHADGDGALVFARDISERRRAEGAVLESDGRFRRLFEEATEGIVLADAETGVILDCNRAFTALSGYDRDELIGRPQASLHPPDAKQPSSPTRTFLEHRDRQEGAILPAELLTRSGEIKQVEIKANGLDVGGRRVMQGFFRDVTGELQLQRERETTLKLLRLLNNHDDIRDLIRHLTGFLKSWTGCEAVGVRLREGPDFPYFETTGFPARFVAAERYLCTTDALGRPICDVEGYPLLECMCGNVLRDRFDPDRPFFTAKGSFWTNCSTELLATTTDAERQARTRNRCNGEGYESVALVALKHGGETLGLIQFNDHERGRFTPELLSFLERLADQVAIALAQRFAQASLRASERRIQHLNQLLRAIRDIDALIVHETDPERIVGEACQILVKTRGYLLVWVGRPDEARLRLLPVARAGAAADYVDEMVFALDDSPTGLGPTGMAYRTRRPWMCQDVAADPAFAPWRAAAQKRGYASMAAIPMINGDRVFGVVHVYADRRNAFDTEEIGLLQELASDLAFALQSIEHADERRRGEAQIRDQATLLDLAQDAILVRDLDGRIRYWNRGAVELYGWTAREAIGQAVTDLCGPATPELDAAKARLLATGSWSGELHPLTKDRREVTINSRWTLVRDSLGLPKSVLVIDTDITERKRLEAQFLRAQRVEGIGQLAGGVAHDFNNILAAIMLQLDLLRDVPNLDEEVVAGLADVGAEAQRAAGLTRQLLLFSRRQAMQVRRLDLNEVVRSLVRMLGRLVGEHIAMDLVEHPGAAWVEADAGMLEQVVMNLCLNARDAMPGGGRLTVRVERTTVVPEEARQQPDAAPGRFVVLAISDTGHGIDEATLSRIFEPFFTTKEVGKGTGLGLATVYSIARQHHGWVAVDSAVHEGTTFRVFLPEALPPDAACAAVPPADPAGGTETILLVEDDSSVRRMASQTLGRLGYRVLEAGNGVEALERWDEHAGAIDLLLTDLVMPEQITGVELAERLRRLRPGLKVVISSGYSADHAGRQTRLPDGIEFLSKPYRVGDLAAAVRRCLDGPRFLSGV